MERDKDKRSAKRPLAESKAWENVKMILFVGISFLLFLLGYFICYGFVKVYERYNSESPGIQVDNRIIAMHEQSADR